MRKKIGYSVKSNASEYNRYQLYDSVVFPVNLFIGTFNKTISEFDDVLESIDTNCLESMADAVTFQSTLKNNNEIVVCIAFDKDAKENVWVHEAVHASMFFCNMYGIKVTQEDDETHAYLVEWVYKCIRDFFTNEDKKKEE